MSPESEPLRQLKDHFDLCVVKMLERISDDDEKGEAVKYIKTKLAEIEQKVVKVEKIETSALDEQTLSIKEEYFESEESIKEEKREVKPDVDEGHNIGEIADERRWTGDSCIRHHNSSSPKQYMYHPGIPGSSSPKNKQQTARSRQKWKTDVHDRSIFAEMMKKKHLRDMIAKRKGARIAEISTRNSSEL